MRPLSLAVVKIRKKEKENTRNFDVNNNKKKRILSTNQNSAGFEGIVVESLWRSFVGNDVQSSVRDPF